LALKEKSVSERAKTNCDTDVAVPASISDISERGERLRQAVRAAGGASAVARSAGIPLTTLNRYFGKREMKVDTIVALAAATGVRLEWLATGAGPMRAGAPENPQPAAPQRPVRMFRDLHMDTLADAFAAALQALAARGQANPDPRRVMQITAILYDQLREGVELGSYSSEPPNKD
jgi:AcrR family transcriptional regulator